MFRFIAIIDWRVLMYCSLSLSLLTGVSLFMFIVIVMLMFIVIIDCRVSYLNQ